MPLLAAQAQTAVLSTPVATAVALARVRRPPVRRPALMNGSNATRSYFAFFSDRAIS